MRKTGLRQGGGFVCKEVGTMLHVKLRREIEGAEILLTEISANSVIKYMLFISDLG